MAGLVLRAVDVTGPTGWRWLLTDAAGRFVADHEVVLDESEPLYEAFVDLYGFVRRNRTPDDTVRSEAALVADVGAWVGARVLGAVGPALSGTALVELPPEAMFLLQRPLELAHVDGQPLARRGVTLVYQLAGAGSSDAKEPVEDRLRILALFSLPSAGSVLALRRERYELVRKVREIAGVGRLAIELRVLQYGATRERLSEAVQEYPGWDILHISGHGTAGAVLLEKEDGSPDLVTTPELVALLAPAQARLKLAVLSACQSGADLAVDTLRTLDLPDAAEQLEQTLPQSPAGSGQGLARGLVDKLAVAVLAMRYPVVDSYAVALTGELYPLLLRGGQPVDRALALAVRTAAGAEPSMARPALSIATAALFGPAVGLRLTPPKGETALDVFAERLAGFPPEPERFVGRTQTLVTASAALAPDSDLSGVWFVGMAGAGKTACALELAHQHRNRFKRLAWWQAPTQPDEHAQAMAGLAHAMESQLGIPTIQAVGSESALRAFLPHLRALLREESVLIVLDNLETLLTSSRTWRDPLWALLMDTLLGHGGLSRVVATSRQAPADLDATRMPALATHALSLAESVLLARELPNLARLLHDEPHAERTAAEIKQDRDLARNVLRVVQGHPKLLELADAAAADPERLAQALNAATTAGEHAPIQAFFATGTSDLSGDQFLAVLRAWTQSALAGLPAPARVMAELVAAVEDDDRISPVINMAWPHVWADLRAPSDDDTAPGVGQVLDWLRAAALVEVVERQLYGSADGGGGSDVDGLVGLRMHPGVAEAVRAVTDPAHRSCFDLHLAGLWTAVFDNALAAEMDGRQASQMIVRAGLSAAPYLMRVQQWSEATHILESAAARDSSSEVTLQVLGYFRQIQDSTPDVEVRAACESLYAWLLTRIDPAAAEVRLRGALDDARARGRHGRAFSIAGDLASVLRERGNLAGALQMLDTQVESGRLAGVGPWSQALSEAQRLLVLAMSGQHRQVIIEADALLLRMAALPAESGADEQTQPFTPLELTLDAGCTAALALREWHRALDFNRRIQYSKRRRGASRHEQARTRLNEYGPLLRLGQLTEARQLLLECQQTFEDAGDIGMLGNVFGARAELELQLDHPELALRFQYTTLRYLYLVPRPEYLIAGHNNLAIVLGNAGGDTGEIVAHQIAAGLLALAGGEAARFSDVVARLGRQLGDAWTVPAAGLDDVVDTVQSVPGVRFIDVLEQLVPDQGERDRMFAGILTTARNHAIIAEQLRQWEPVIADVVAAARGNAEAAAQLAPFLDDLTGTDEWAKLTRVIQEIIAGGRDAVSLLDGLDPVDTAIAHAVLDELRSAAVPTDHDRSAEDG